MLHFWSDFLSDDCYCTTFFKYFGLLTFSCITLKYAYKILNNTLTFVFGFGLVNFKKYGTWAVVTGCTDGIGKSYVENFAKQGLNVVLISRSFEKLEEQSKHLQEKYSILTKVIAVDFTGNIALKMYLLKFL